MPATTPSTTPAVPEIRVSRTVTREPSAKSWAAGPIGAGRAESGRAMPQRKSRRPTMAPAMVSPGCCFVQFIGAEV